MKHVDHGHWPGLRLMPLTGELLRARHPHGYRTRRPGWLWPTIRLSPDPDRCAHLQVERFDLVSPDYHIEEDGQPDIPMALCVCHVAGECRYQAVLSPNRWHTFGPVCSCAAFDPVYLNKARAIVDTAPSRGAWWPQSPPSEPRAVNPSMDELVEYAGRMVLRIVIHTLNTTNHRQAIAAARLACKAWRGRPHGCPFAPVVTIRDGTVRIWPPHGEPQRTPPAAELTVDAFLDLVLPPPARQLAFAL